MKKRTKKWLAIGLAALTLLPAFSSCTTDAPPLDTSDDTSIGMLDTQAQTSQEDVSKPPRDTYTDLSGNIPTYKDPDTDEATATVEGTQTSSAVLLDFSCQDGSYVLTKCTIAGCHELVDCQVCGYTTHNGQGAYRFETHGKDLEGVTVTLAVPILASSITGAEAVFATSKNAATSQLRLLKAGETNNAAFHNECGSMAGAVGEWKTIDLGTDFAFAADSDGYVRSFQICFRNKNGTDCYLQSIKIATSPDPLLQVDDLTGNLLFKQGVAQAVADIIASRFEQLGMGADIHVKVSKYRANSSSKDGSCTYNATVTLKDGSTLTHSGNLTIPYISGMWLDASGGRYGATNDTHAQWQDTFDPSGLVMLTDSVMTCAEGVADVSYAVVEGDVPYDDPHTVWHTPHILEMNEEGIAYLFTNAYLDYANILTTGETYHLLVRGETKHQNYILHLDIPFVYAPLSDVAQNALVSAYEALQGKTWQIDPNTPDKAVVVAQMLQGFLNDQDIKVNVTPMGEGVNSLSVGVTLSYTAPIDAPRLPEYTYQGTPFKNVYDFVGKAFGFERMTIDYGTTKGDIMLTTPFDGEFGIILATKQVYAHAQAGTSDIMRTQYDYPASATELCTPPPVLFGWDDPDFAEGDSYTLTISKSIDLKNPVCVMKVDGKSAEVEHLQVGETYYWQVTKGDKASLVYTFQTADGYARFLHVEGVSNVRDLGGYVTTDGKRVKQDILLRAAQLDGITEEGKAVLLEKFGVKTDLDLRGKSTSPLGGGVRNVKIAAQWYSHIFDEENYGVTKDTIVMFADPANYPMIFHCSMGRDRTGTASLLILGLCGVDKDTLLHEFYVSSYSYQGHIADDEFAPMVSNIKGLISGLEKFGEKQDSLQTCIENYLLHIGVTQEQMDSIRNILLED